MAAVIIARSVRARRFHPARFRRPTLVEGVIVPADLRARGGGL